ncbi:MAG: T9SS type A sorting domain-containing protein [Flavobacteriales bacterium]|nr:T9SS type A sorting domain-containing protein [Flavobacteriales bacterium]
MKQLNLYRTIFAAILLFGVFGTANSQNLTCSDIGGIGDLNTRCVIANQFTMLSDGDIISGTGILELENHGELLLNAGESFTINMGGDLIIQNGGRIYGNADITCNNLYVDGAINSTARGFLSSDGPGAGADVLDSIKGGGGAAYGGNGGQGQNTTGTSGSAYDFALTQPTQMGSGGGEQQFWIDAEGGAGGGAIKIIAAGIVTINGTIGANGDVGFCMGLDYCSGGGSGGSIWLQANELRGTGSITANGGNGGIGTFAGGGGGGGRIALYYSSNNFLGAVTAIGGYGVNAGKGGAGSVYELDGTAGSLTIVNNMFSGALTPLDLSISQTFDDLTIGDSARVYLYGSMNTVIGNFTVAEAGIVRPPINQSFLNLSVDNFYVNTGGLVDYKGKGYAAAAGPGMGGSVNVNTEGAGGGGYASDGGQGENGGGAGGIGGLGYELQPTDFGSGGGNINYGDTAFGGYGGGTIWLNVVNVLNIDGIITAEGMDGSSINSAASGGGSGGSLVLCAETITGSGRMSVNGGNGGTATYDGGGGSGGRLAMYAQTNSYFGIKTAMAGMGFSSNPGGPGSFISETDCGIQPPILIDIDETEMNIDDFKVYPNPNTGSFNVSMFLGEKKDLVIRVFDVIGREIYSESLSQVEGELVRPMYLGNERSGIYYLTVITDEVVFNEKIVLQR